MKILALASHRPEKITKVIPYTGFDYETIIILKKQSSRLWVKFRFILRWLAFVNFFKYRGIYRRIKASNPDVIICNVGLGFWVTIVSKILKKKVIVRMGGNVYEEGGEQRGLLSLPSFFNPSIWATKWADHIIVVSQDMRRKLSRDSGIDEFKISVLPVSIDIERFSRDGATPTQGKHILTVFNTNFKAKTQGLIDYIPAVVSVLRNNYPRARYTIIAPGRNYDMVKSFIDEKYPIMQLEGIIDLLGWVDNVEDYYRKADVLAYFSYQDGCPNVILEAWAARLPIVANYCEWSAELIQDGYEGLLAVTPADASFLIGFVLDNPMIAAKIADYGQRKVLAGYTHEYVGRMLGNIVDNYYMGWY